MEALQQIEVDFLFDPAVDGLLSNEEKVTVYRVIQEQTSNIIKYAAATKVCISIAVSELQLILVVSDNGKGFDPDNTEGRKGIGLFNMQSRARSHFGSFGVRSAPGKGTMIEMRFPLAAYSPTITNAPQK
jgi:signal transduction histidine kinase